MSKTILIYENVEKKYKVKMLITEWWGVLESILKEWKNLLKEQEEPEKCNLFLYYSHFPKIASMCYKTLNQHTFLASQTYDKWNCYEDIDFDTESIKKSIKWVYTITNIAKFRSFQIRLIYHAIITNKNLMYFKTKETDLCTFCNNHSETVYHLFIKCVVVKEFWYQLSQKILLLRNLEINAVNIILNEVTDNLKLLLNVILLLAKLYIYIYRQ